MVAIGKTSSGWPAICGLALAIMAGCLGDPDGREDWQGLVLRTCGPADGPAASIQVDSVAPPDCGDGQGSIPNYGTHTLYLEDVSVDSLQAGVTYRDSTQFCQLECGPKTWFALEVESVTTDRVKGTLEVQGEAGGKRRLVRKVNVNLKKCSQGGPFCG